jgi:hypothetical protein
MSIKLTDTHLVLLSAAAQREDGCLVASRTLKGGAAQRVANKLISCGLVKEIKAKTNEPVWRRDEGSGASYALRLTAAGAKAIVADEYAEPENANSEGDALENHDQRTVPSETAAKNAVFEEAMGHVPARRSTRRLEAGSGHQIASAAPWRDHQRVDRRNRLACAHDPRRADRLAKTRICGRDRSVRAWIVLSHPDGSIRR